LGRGIQIVYEAIPEIVKKINNFLFVVLGDGYAAAKLKNEIRERNLEDYVLWAGWVEHRKLYEYIKCSSIGLIPHYTSKHVNTTIPNKIFDYMGFGLPIISSDAIPMKRILEEEKCGITFKSSNAEDFANAVIHVYNNISDYKNNGIAAIKNKYNWDKDEKRLLNAIHKVFSRVNPTVEN